MIRIIENFKYDEITEYLGVKLRKKVLIVILIVFFVLLSILLVNIFDNDNEVVVKRVAPLVEDVKTAEDLTEQTSIKEPVVETLPSKKELLVKETKTSSGGSAKKTNSGSSAGTSSSSNSAANSNVYPLILPGVEQEINTNGNARVIVSLKEGAVFDLGASEFQEKFEINDLNLVAGILTREGLDKLKQNPGAVQIEFDLPLVPSTLESIPLIKGDVVGNMVVNGVNINGTGQTICVVDTGVNYTHPELGGCTKTQFLAGNCSKVINGTNIYMATNDPMDLNGHGTGIAGIAAADGANYKGIAPGAKILAVTVTSSSGGGWTSRLAAGINWCTSSANIARYNVTTILTGVATLTRYNSASTCNGFSPTSAINNAVSKNITVYGASGNNGDTSAISYPACASNVIGLAAVEDGTGTTTADNFWTTSNRHAMLDLLAPGTLIQVLTKNVGVVNSSGTSLAAAHTAGASLLLNQYNLMEYNQQLTPAQLKNVFKLTGKSIIDSVTNLTFPRIDLLRAVNHETFPPVVTSISPVNNLKNPGSVTPVTFSYNVTDHHNVNNCSLYVNGALNQTSINVPQGATQTFSLNNLNPGNYNWLVGCYDNATFPNQGNSSTWLYKVNYPPVLSSVLNQTVQINSTNNLLDLSSYVSDGDNDPISIVILNENTSQVNCGVSGLNLTMTPATNYIGSASCTILVNDSLENSSSQLINIKVIPLNAAPNITSTPATTGAVGSLYSYNVTATDAENDTLTYSLTTSPTGMSINSATGVIIWTPVSGQQGGNNVVVRVSDLGGFTIQSFTITVSNSLPVITTTAPTAAAVGAAYSYDVNATDADLDILTYSLTTSPTGMSINSATGLITWTPISGQQGNNGVVVSVSDSFNAVTQSFTITVPNNAPVLGLINNITVNESQLVSITPSATDADSDTLSYTFTSPLNSSGQWQTTYYDAGTYTVTVMVNDGNGGSDFQNVTIVVNDVLVTDIASQYFLKQIPASPQSNTFTTFGFMVTNTGGISVNNVTWFLDSNSSDTNVNGTIPFVGINSSQLVMAKINYTSPGNYTPKIILDYTLSIPETNESNNIATTFVTVA